MMRTLFLNPPSYGGFDGGAGSRYQAKREIRSLLLPDMACISGRNDCRKPDYRCPSGRSGIATYFLGEEISMLRRAGTVVIVIGIGLVALEGKPRADHFEIKVHNALPGIKSPGK